MNATHDAAWSRIQGRAGRMEMKNQQTGKATDLLWTNYKFRSGLAESDFDSNRLKSISR
ncbi:MAG: hypothetical protein AAF479_10880 [Pseudomonadota bacterium]